MRKPVSKFAYQIQLVPLYITVDAMSEVRRAKDRAMARATTRLDEVRLGLGLYCTAVDTADELEP